MEEKKRAKRQHILPRSYLHRFAEDNNIWVVDLHNKTIFRTSIENALCIRYFYTVQTVENPQDDVIEKFLSAIESDVKPIIDRMLNEMIFPQGPDREILDIFVASLHLRGPHMRQTILEIHESGMRIFAQSIMSNEKTFSAMMNQAEKGIGKKLDLTYEQAKEVYENSQISADIPRTYYVKNFLEFLPIIAVVLNKMTLRILFANPSGQDRFITGDHPFGIEFKTENPTPFLGRGLLDKDIRIFVPLSPLTCLALEYDVCPTVIPLLYPKDIAVINTIITLASSRYVISRSDEITWLKPDRSISRCSSELMNNLSALKKEQPHVEINLGGKFKVVPRSDWNVLKGRDHEGE